MNARWTFAAAALIAATATATLASEAGAQGRGRRDRAGGAPIDSLRTLEAQNPIAMLLEHSGDLALTADQTNAIAAIKQRLNARQRPLVAELDSLRVPGPQPRLDPTAISSVERDSLLARRRAVGEVMAQLRTLEQGARTDAWALLTADQKQSADKLETKLRDAARRGRDDRGADGPDGRDGRGGFGGGRPPR